MSQDSDHRDHEAVEFVQSAKGLWDGRGWVPGSDAALPYPALPRRADVACRIVEAQTGLRCWVLAIRPKPARPER